MPLLFAFVEKGKFDLVWREVIASVCFLYRNSAMGTGDSCVNGSVYMFKTVKKVCERGWH